MDRDLVEDAVRVESFVTSGDGPSSPYPLPLDISQYWVAPSNFGGPISYVPKCTQERPDDAAIIFTTSTGKFMSHHINQNLLEMDQDNPIAMVDWSERQTLVILYRDGQAIFYHGPTDKQPYINCLAMLGEGDSVLRCTMGIGTSMLSFVTSNLCLFVATNIDGEDPEAIAYDELQFLDSTRPPRCMALLVGSETNKKPRVVLPCIGMGIVVVHADKPVEVHTIDAWRDNTIVAMSSHPTSNHICLCTENLMASVHRLENGTFETLIQVKIDNEVIGNAFCVPKELGWLPCGDQVKEGYMTLSFEKPPWCPEGWGILIIDGADELITSMRDYQECIDLHLVQEMDGVRVVCATGSCEDDELLRAIPSYTLEVTSSGSISPGALLKDARDALEERDPRCDEHIKDLKEMDSLDVAVESCIEAAKFERDLQMQLSLVKSAAYGARFMEDADDQREMLEDLDELCRELRVIHSLRRNVGMSMTVLQYEDIGSLCVVSRVALWSMHGVALQMCAHLKIPGDRIAEHWSCERIRNASEEINDQVLYDTIRSKLPGNSSNHSGGKNNSSYGSSGSSGSSNNNSNNTNTSNNNNSNNSNSNSNNNHSGTKDNSDTKDSSTAIGSPNRYRSSADRALTGLLRGGRPTSVTKKQNGPGNFISNNREINGSNRNYSSSTAVPTFFSKASLVPAAKQAMECRRPQLARKLLRLEPVLMRQVEALVTFDLLDEALDRAKSSSDTDLMYYVLIQAKKGLQWGQFFELIARHPKMMSLMLLFWQQSGQETYICQFFKKTAAHMIAGKYMMQEAMLEQDLDERNGLLKMSAKAYEFAGNEGAPFVEVVENRIRLEQAQRQLSHTLVGKSLRKTIFDAVRRQEYELAEQLATKFKLRPRYYLLTKLKALVAAHAWTELEKMSNERSAQKELNGLYEFFKACFDQGNSQAALQFAIRIKDPSQRLDSFICLEIWDEAADMALELRDEMAKEMAIERIKKCCRDEDIRHIILAKFQNAPKVKKTRGFLGSLF